ncbi:uncharacterized protein LOC120326982 [Styela clava]
MPSARDRNSAPHRLLTTIYRQNWPPPAKSTRNLSHEPPRNNKDFIENPWKSGEPVASNNSNKISRPFSASLISPRRRKKSDFMTARRSSTSISGDVRGLNSSTFKKVKPPTKPKVPEYDGAKLISESASARNKALAAEYLAMLSGRNFLKRQYRDQYWNSEIAYNHTRPTTASRDERRYRTLYPDLGSVIGSNKPVTPAASAPSAGPWRLASPPTAPQNTSLHEQISTDNQIKEKNSESITSISDLGITYTLKRSWSNIPSGRCYRILSQPNDTLASLSLEGRQASRTSTRTSSLSSSVSFTGVVERNHRRLSSAGESSPSGSSGVVGDEDQLHSYVFGGTEDANKKEQNKNDPDSDEELSMVHGLSDSVFTNDDAVRTCETDYEDDEDDEDFEQNLMTSKQSHISYSDLEESDISENEAGDDEDIVDKDEFSRRLQQVSLVFEASKHKDIDVHHNEMPVAIVIDRPDDDNDSVSSTSWSDENESIGGVNKSKKAEYKYSEVLPNPFNECDFRLFATLPHNMDWRTFIQPPYGKKKAGKNATKFSYRKTDVEKRRLERKIRENEEKKRQSLEELVDRIVMLEKMQMITVQYEQDRKKHQIHRAKARNSARAASNNNTAQNTNRTSSPSPTPPAPQSAKPARRRSCTVSAGPTLSIPVSKPRRSVSSAELTATGLGNTLSPDIDLVRLSCTKNHLQYYRHFSQNNKKRQRCGSTLPRYYEYSWSERLPPSKRPSLNSLNYSKPRNCHFCRESEKKLAHLHITQMTMGRPRSSFSTFTSEQQKLLPRPSTTNSTTKSRIENKTLDSSNSREKQNSKALSSSFNGTIPSTFGRAPLKPTVATQEKIFAAHAMLSSVARDYVKAARRAKTERIGSAPVVIATRSRQRSPSNRFRFVKQSKSGVIKSVHQNLV